MVMKGPGSIILLRLRGCSKQTVYHHFGNKENLFIEVLEYTWNDIRQKEKALDFSDLPPQKAIEKLLILHGIIILLIPGF